VERRSYPKASETMSCNTVGASEAWTAARHSYRQSTDSIVRKQDTVLT
jgi:hypothetical protein